ncbi:porin, gram-negative type [Leptothrix cholodnii SP-6]|uniref:Porin, gram-negative type n=1 Tax=Leptothrix cholodnii (strain ATCC 51168 / LMG 8142 / SP-6) TaxID=395495 RepID=B1Y0K7_LEPCP|nr:porin [Leptothrix cholodnii]ACB32988.1 porin, gram-negative type [Leptothrix cholodnii SP-6]
MEKIVIVLGLASLGLSHGAHAQSSVSVSGVLDAGLRNVSNSGLPALTTLVSGSNATSRLAVQGTEDIGGGLSAGFHLEHGLNVANGTATTATQFWDRRATVSLADSRFGEWRLGRDFIPTYTNWSRYDPFGHVGAASAGNLVSTTPVGPLRNSFGTNPNTTVRANSEVQWLLPKNLGGVEGSVMLTKAGDTSAASGANNVKGFRLGWSGGPLSVGLAHTRTRNDLTVAGALTDSSVGGIYNFGVVRLSAVVRHIKQADAKQTNQLLGAWVPVGAGEIRLSVQRADLSGRVGAAVVDANDAVQVGLGYVRSLSKRTALYTTWARIANSGAGTRTISGGTSGMAGGGTSKAIELGLRHNF